MTVASDIGVNLNSSETFDDVPTAADESSILAPIDSSNDGPPHSLLEPTIGDPDLGLAQVLSDVPCPSTARPHRSKCKAPLLTTEVRRSTRSTRFDCFRVPQITDVRVTSSKVKPRVTPSATAPGYCAPMDQPPPPPTPLRVMQDISTTRCAVPPQELTYAALMASDDLVVNSASLEEDSSASA